MRYCSFYEMNSLIQHTIHTFIHLTPKNSCSWTTNSTLETVSIIISWIIFHTVNLHPGTLKFGESQHTFWWLCYEYELFSSVPASKLHTLSMEGFKSFSILNHNRTLILLHLFYKLYIDSNPTYITKYLFIKIHTRL